MKIYISEKEEFFKIAKDYSERDMLNISLLSNNNHTITLQEGTKIQSLEQHEEEIRKPLEDKIKELKVVERKLNLALNDCHSLSMKIECELKPYIKTLEIDLGELSDLKNSIHTLMHNLSDLYLCGHYDQAIDLDDRDVDKGYGKALEDVKKICFDSGLAEKYTPEQNDIDLKEQ